MKNLIKILLSLSLLCSIQLNAQESTYVRQPGYWTLGLNGGLAYQSSDVKSTLDGWGVGATLAKNLYYRPGSTFAFDLRGRLLYDQSFGLEHQRSFGIDNNTALGNYKSENGGLGYAFLNSKTHHGELGLEGVLSFNRLREKTNINLSLFGGIGLDYYATYTDQENSNGQLYDYSTIDPSGSRRTNKAELTNLLDGRYETKAEGFGDAGKLAFMPAVGLELGYQLTPRFSIGLGHKLTFTRSDIFDGNQWNENNRVTGTNDWHHYTNLHLRWIIEKGEKEIQPPIIEMMTPLTNPHRTRDPLAIIKAKVKHVNSAMDIEYSVNGQPTNFNFRNEILDHNFYLRPGRNSVDITATNSAGSDRERLTIFYEEGGVIIPPVTETDTRTPRVNFTNPSRSPAYVQSNSYRVTATVLNVNRKQDIEFKLNGRNISNFNFDTRNDRFSCDVQLRNGENRLQISVCNDSKMTDSDEAKVVVEKTEILEDLPVVNITRPSNDPYETSVNNYRIEADVYNVPDKINVVITVNGNRVRSYSYTNNKATATVDLRNGRNTIKVTGKNERGQDSDQTIIIYEEEVSIAPPTVSIISISQPTIDPFNPDQCKVSVKAKVRNVESKNDINVYLDGNSYNDFTYTASNEEVRVVFTLQKGNTYNVRFKATNAAGSDEDSDQITSCSGTPDGEAPEVDITAPTKTSTDQGTTGLKATVKRVDAKSDISVLVNGRSISFNYDSRRKVVTATVNLNEGNNKIKVSANNNYGSDSDEINIRYSKVVTPKAPPIVTITRPENNSTTESNSTNLNATIQHVINKKDIRVLLNGKTVRDFSFASRGGRLSATVSGLKEGANTIVVKATNKDGSDEASVRVTYKAKLVLPTVRITSPRDGLSTEETTVQVKASLTNVSSKRDISLKVNGRAVNDFSFSRNVLTATVSLRVGANDIFVEGRNSSGKADDQVRVIYEQAMLPPVVKVTQPKNKTITEKKSIEVNASIGNVKSKKDLTLKVNGKSVKISSFSRNLLTATVSLKEGTNTIFVEGRNKSGKDSDQITVTYKKKVAPPIVKITSPKNGSTAKKKTVSLSATLSNVASNNNITLKVNGRTISKFSYRKGKLSATVTLKEGDNSISVTGTNSAGRDSDEVRVSFSAAKNPPKINSFGLSQPTIDPFNPDSAKSSATATLQNITSKSQIKMYINGKEVTDFEYGIRTKRLRKVFDLKRGTNTVRIVVENEDGKKEETKSLKF
ncbi:MAG: hypothetical protein ACI8YQ_001136 [Polaribacter sp.]|jgi:hypothetical protein